MNQAARLSYRRAPAQRTAITKLGRQQPPGAQLGRLRAITRVPTRQASLRNWWISAASLAFAGVIELILAGRMAVQTIDLHGALAQLVFDAGGILQSPFVDISKQPVYAHGVFEPDTIRAIIAYAAIGLVVPALGLIGSVPGVSFGFVRGTARLIGQTAVSLADLAKNGARGGRWAWITAPHLSREAGPAFSRMRLRAISATEHLGGTIERTSARVRAASQQLRPAADQALASARERKQQLGPAFIGSREWSRQASREALSLLKELQARAISAAQVYRRWADDLAAKRH